MRCTNRYAAGNAENATICVMNKYKIFSARNPTFLFLFSSFLSPPPPFSLALLSLSLFLSSPLYSNKQLRCVYSRTPICTAHVRTRCTCVPHVPSDLYCVIRKNGRVKLIVIYYPRPYARSIFYEWTPSECAGSNAWFPMD